MASKSQMYQVITTAGLRVFFQLAQLGHQDTIKKLLASREGELLSCKERRAYESIHHDLERLDEVIQDVWTTLVAEDTRAECALSETELDTEVCHGIKLRDLRDAAGRPTWLQAMSLLHFDVLAELREEFATKVEIPKTSSTVWN
jgi:hypothetical protein